MGLWRAVRRSALAGLAFSLVAVLPRTAASASATERFGEVDGPTAAREPEVIGSYSRGCLRGSVELPATGPGWEVMRTSRNRNWGHPSLIAFVERLAAETRRAGGPGILVGDMAQPRGGPLRYGHASHQIGLDVDVWLTPPPDRILKPDARESLLAVAMVEDDRYAIAAVRFGRFQAALIRVGAIFPDVEVVF